MGKEEVQEVGEEEAAVVVSDPSPDSLFVDSFDGTCSRHRSMWHTPGAGPCAVEGSKPMYRQITVGS